MSRAVRIFLVVGLVLGAVGSAGLWWLGSDGGGPAIPTHRVTSETFRREVPADGTLQAVEATPILAPREARMALKVAWMVEDGQRVKKGDVVVRFDPSEMKNRLQDGRANTSQTRKRIAKERTTSSFGRRKRDLEASLAESEMKAASKFKYEDNEVFSRNEIIESQIDTELAAAKMEHAKATKKIERSVSAGKLDVLRVQERQAELEVTRAEKALTNLEITAPSDGIVLLHRDWRGRQMSVGDTVWPGQKLAELPADDTLQAEVFVLEADGGALEPKMKATVIVESQPGREYAATIKRVDTLAQPRIPEVPVQYFQVDLALEKTDREVMKIGNRVRATILIEEAEAIVVPRQAVFAERGGNFVYRRTNSGFDKVEVELGPGTAGRVAVTKGLAEGDEIALRDPSSGSASDAGSAPGEAPVKTTEGDDEAR